MILAIDVVPSRNAAYDVRCGFRRCEANVVVPLVIGTESGDAPADGVIGIEFDFRRPVRVCGVSGLVVSADPLIELFPLFTLWNFDSVVHAHEADAIADKFVHLGFVSVNGMPGVSVRVNDDRAGAFEDGIVFGPSVVSDGHFHWQAALFPECPGEQNDARFEFVLTRGVARYAGDENNLGGFDCFSHFVGGVAAGSREEGECCQGQCGARGDGVLPGLNEAFEDFHVGY